MEVIALDVYILRFQLLELRSSHKTQATCRSQAPAWKCKSTLIQVIVDTDTDP